jgi:hypothetical protein
LGYGCRHQDAAGKEKQNLREMLSRLSRPRALRGLFASPTMSPEAASMKRSRWIQADEDVQKLGTNSHVLPDRCSTALNTNVPASVTRRATFHCTSRSL